MDTRSFTKRTTHHSLTDSTYRVDPNLKKSNGSPILRMNAIVLFNWMAKKKRVSTTTRQPLGEEAIAGPSRRRSDNETDTRWARHRSSAPGHLICLGESSSELPYSTLKPIGPMRMTLFFVSHASEGFARERRKSEGTEIRSGGSSRSVLQN